MPRRLRFRDHTNDYPWNWSAGDLGAWSSELLAGRQARTVRTLQNHIGRFLGYLLDPAYEWAAVCEQYFGTHPVQICSDRSYITHLLEDGWDLRFVQTQSGHVHATTTIIRTSATTL